MNPSVIGTFVIFFITIQQRSKRQEQDAQNKVSIQQDDEENLMNTETQEYDRVISSEEKIDIKENTETQENERVISSEEKLDIKELPGLEGAEKLGLEDEQVQREEGDADIFDIFNQQHQYYPKEYSNKDLGRRHQQEPDYDVEDDSLDFDALRSGFAEQRDRNRLIPVEATPDFVYAVAQKSEAINKYNVKHHPEYFAVPKEVLRSGQYWNSFWVEKLDPKQQQQKALRSAKLTKQRQKHAPGLESVKAKIQPGSELYKVISRLTNTSPKLLYVINGGNK